MELTSTVLSNLRKYLEEEGEVGRLFEEATLNLRSEELKGLRWLRVEHQGKITFCVEGQSLTHW